MRLPVRLHGWGLRSLAETCGPAYLGALETAIPYMAARDKLCPAMEMEWGGEECWGEAADPGSRWRVLLQSGCLEGVELRRWWEGLQQMVRESTEYLGEPLDNLLTSSLEGLGGALSLGRLGARWWRPGTPSSQGSSLGHCSYTGPRKTGMPGLGGKETSSALHGSCACLEVVRQSATRSSAPLPL